MSKCVGCAVEFTPSRFHPQQKWCTRRCCDTNTKALRLKKWKMSVKGKMWNEQYKPVHRLQHNHNAREQMRAPLNRFKARVRRITWGFLLQYEQGGECLVCGAYDTLETHHLRYRMPPQREDVVSLCKVCHARWHQHHKAEIIGPIRFGTRIQVEVE